MRRFPWILARAFSVLAFATSSSLRAADPPDLEPIPTFYAEAGLSPNRDYVNQRFSEYIDPFSGKLQLHYVDLFIPGNGGFGLRVQRSYSSLDERLAEPSPFGMGWTMHFGRILRKAPVPLCAMNLGPQVNPVFEAPDGSRQILYPGITVGNEPPFFITTSRWKAVCLGPGTGLLLSSPDGTRYLMTEQGPTVGSAVHPQNSWYPSRIVDRNDNWMEITYASSPLFLAVQQVTTRDGRTVDFHYLGSGGPLESITDGSRTWHYEVTPVPNTPDYYFLKRAIRPDGTSWSYEYNETLTDQAGSYSLRRLSYPTAGSFDYTYKFHYPYTAINMPRATVVASKTGDGGLWTFDYRAATKTYEEGGADAQMFDETRVTGPEGVATYWHLGYGSARPGTVWAIGLLLQKDVGDVFSEFYDIGSVVISNQTNQRPGAVFVFDNEVRTPQRFGRGFSRDGAAYMTEYFDHDEHGNPQTIEETGPGLDAPSTRQTTLTYFVRPDRWILHVKKDETIADVGTIARTFDDNGNLQIEDRFGVRTTFSHTSEGDLSTRTDARQKTTTYETYYRGLPQRELQPEDVTVTRVVSPAGNVESETDGEQKTTEWDYDGLARVTAIRHPEGNPVGVVWTGNSRTLTRGAYKELTQYDPFGRVKSVTATDTATGETILQTFRYDPLGRRTFASYPNGGEVGTGYEYDILGRLKAVRHAFRGPGQWDASRLYTYEPAAVAVQNERDFKTRTIYRAFGDPAEQELVAVEAAVPSANVEITRNPLGQIRELKQAGLVRTFHYDSRQFMDWSIDPEIGRTDFVRDDIGNLRSKRVAGGPLLEFVYDGRNRLHTVTYPEGDRNVLREYYRDDRPKSIDNGLARREYVYDGNKNLTQETLALPGRTFTVGYGYDGNDALARITHGVSGKAIDYSPDAFGRPTRAGSYVISVQHHATGELKSKTYANGVTTTVTLDMRLRPEALRIQGRTPLFSLTHTYDGVGNVQGVLDGVDGSLSRGLGYDAIDRLTSASGPWGPGTIAYDGRGNITSQVLGGWSLGYDYDPARNRLRSVSGVKAATYAYDVQGNVTGDGTTSFGFDSASQMRCARCGQPDEIRYEYDGAGQRVSRTQNGQTTYFMHGQGGELLFEDTPGDVLKEYVYLGGKQVVVRETRP
jgi:YD repeat-containing protein